MLVAKRSCWLVLPEQQEELPLRAWVQHRVQDSLQMVSDMTRRLPSSLQSRGYLTELVDQCGEVCCSGLCCPPAHCVQNSSMGYSQTNRHPART